MHGRLRLRPMTLRDLNAVAALDRRVYDKSAWSREHFRGEITDSPISIFYVLTLKESIVGYFGTWHVVDQLQLCTIAIEPDQQGQGLGAILLQSRLPTRPAA